MAQGSLVFSAKDLGEILLESSQLGV